MPASISQAQLDRAALRVVASSGAKRELVTYTAKATLASSPTVYANVEMLLDEYRLADLVPDIILPTDRRGRMRTALMAWRPTHYDTITRADGSDWRIISIAGGAGQMFYLFQLREE